ncbi:MAG: hypothetical protein GXX95_11345 [Methanomassiliicoccus sp.]|nr:hypothetical protein [Methanomassiliicoccus sp.]
MGRALGLILVALVLLSGSVVLGSTATAAPLVSSGSLQLNITSPQSTPTPYLLTPYANITWEAYDESYNITETLVYLDNANALSTSLTWVNLTGLSDGRHTVTVWVINEVGSSAESSVVFYIDTTPPTLQIVSPNNGDYLNISEVTVTWQAYSAVGIAYYDVRMDSQPWLTPISYSRTSNTFSSVTNGQHNITVVAHDRGGRTTSSVINLNIDTTIPTVTITDPSDNAGFNHTGVTVSWSGSDAGNNLVGYQIWVDGVKLTTAVPGENHISSSYSKGHHTVRIVAIDVANNTASDEVTFLVDTEVPAIIERSPEGGDVAVDAVIEVNFTKSMDPLATTIIVPGVDGTKQWEGTLLRFTPSSPLAHGATYAVVLNASDAVGNVIASSWSFTTTNLGTISGVITDAEGKPVSGVKVALDSGASVVTDSSGAFTLTAPAGPNNITFSKMGWDSTTRTVEVVAGGSVNLETISVKPSNPLAIYGVVAAVAAVLCALLIFTFRRHKPKAKAPPARSWKGMEDLQRRSRRAMDDDDEDDRL